MIKRWIDGVTIARHYEGNWSITYEGAWLGRANNLHAIAASVMAETEFGLTRQEAREAVADIMREARRSPAGV